MHSELFHLGVRCYTISSLLMMNVAVFSSTSEACADRGCQCAANSVVLGNLRLTPTRYHRGSKSKLWPPAPAGEKVLFTSFPWQLDRSSLLVTTLQAARQSTDACCGRSVSPVSLPVVLLVHTYRANDWRVYRPALVVNPRQSRPTVCVPVSRC